MLWQYDSVLFHSNINQILICDLLDYKSNINDDFFFFFEGREGSLSVIGPGNRPNFYPLYGAHGDDTRIMLVICTSRLNPDQLRKTEP